MNNKIKIRFVRDTATDGIEILIRAPERSKEVESLIRYIGATPTEKLMIKDTNGIAKNISPSDIVTVSVSGKLLNIITEKDRYTVRQSLSEFEAKLDSGKFVRVSRFEIVNLDKVINFDFTLGGTLRLELTGGMETWASRRSIPLIKEKLSGEEG